VEGYDGEMRLYPLEVGRRLWQWDLAKRALGRLFKARTLLRYCIFGAMRRDMPFFELVHNTPVHNASLHYRVRAL